MTRAPRPAPPEQTRPAVGPSVPRATSRPQVHRGFVLVTALFLVAFLALEGAARDLATTLTCLLPTAAVTVRLRRAAPADRPPWFLVLAGLVVLCVYSAGWMVEHHLLGAEPPTSPLATLGLPVGYLLLVAGMALLVRRPVQRDGGTVVDATIIALSLALLLWVLVVEPHLDPEIPTFVRVRTMAVLVAVSAVAGAVARAAYLARSRRPFLVYALVVVAAILLGTLTRDLTMTADAPTGSTWAGAFWIVAYGAGAAGVLHPAAATLSPDESRPGRLTVARLLALGAALAVSPVLLGIEEVRQLGTDPRLIIAANLVLVPLVVARLAQLARWHAEAEDQLAHLATHDELTGLPNRRVIDARVQEALARAAAGTTRGTVVAFLDLDDFKEVNDTLGHRAGDDLLVVVADRLRDALRPEDLLGRFGGDEFVVVMEGEPEVLVETVLPRLASALDDPVLLGDHVVHGAASVGAVQVAPGAGTTAEEALSAADATMYERKAARRRLRTATTLDRPSTG
ncbi:GGDEF domain-containing protein [Actinotalea sp. BY-33]|uniref:GGDEF domain-containing protein n=1 Tax=Actinotalea soli TaxID=2819234 RepID=A0A939LT77_9CELL|nr:GGDEF domain-containing protein [Actinotalea soli]MBO1752265.1 GGDEF domain-containing protein [Actinotalea soli]